MTIAINPTTTIPELTTNTSSAADSFQGLSNGVAKGGNVSAEPLNIPQQFFWHDVDWWDELGKSHIHIGYSSNDPAYIARLITAMKRQGVAGINGLWNGVGSMQDKSLITKKPLFEKAGLLYSQCLSSTIPTFKNATTVAARTTAFNKVLDYFRVTFWQSPAQLRIGGRPQLLCFGLANGDFDWAAIKAHGKTFGADEPLLYFRYELGYSGHAGADGFFGWTHCDQNWIDNAQKLGKPLILGANGGFDNSIAGWGTKQVISQDGGLRIQRALDLGRANPQIKQMMGVTLNDYEEGSALEPGLASGKTLTLAIKDGVLSWNDVGAAFDHDSVLVSTDGVNFGDLLPYLSNATSIDLNKFNFANGTYYFLVRAIGKPFVQNIVSNTVSATLAWK